MKLIERRLGGTVRRTDEGWTCALGECATLRRLTLRQADAFDLPIALTSQMTSLEELVLIEFQTSVDSSEFEQQ